MGESYDMHVQVLHTKSAPMNYKDGWVHKLFPRPYWACLFRVWRMAYGVWRMAYGVCMVLWFVADGKDDFKKRPAIVSSAQPKVAL